MTTQVFIMYGAGGPVYSGPMETVLAPMLRAISGVAVPPTIDWTKWEQIVGEIGKLPATDKVVLIGHSLGGAMMSAIADKVYPRTVDLLVGYDCTEWSEQTLKSNVKYILDYHGHTWVNIFGFDLLWDPTAVYKEVQRNNDYHVGFASDKFLHNLTYEAVLALSKGLPAIT
jgi:hypothetical protein